MFSLSDQTQITRGGFVVALSLPSPLTVQPATPHALVHLLRAQHPHLALSTASGTAANNSDDPMDALLLPGCVVELSALPGMGALSLGLMLLKEQQGRALHSGASPHVCIVDPSHTLCAPAVAALGVSLVHLIVLRPALSQVLRIAVRAQRSSALSAVLVDLSSQPDLSHADIPVRRIALACEATQTLCVLLTSTRAKRGLPLPSGARALVERVDGMLEVRFLKHKFGHRHPVRIPWAA